MSSYPRQLGIVGLTAIVFGSMIGAGIFNIVQNMSAGASVGAVILSWIITALGILMLVLTFKILSDRRPDLDAGIYQYAQKGFGNYVGFNIAWGYWLCTAFANIAYAVMLNDAFGVFFPALLDHSWPTAIFGSALIWVMYVIVIRGIRSAAILNTIISALKISALCLIVAIIVLYFNIDRFEYDFWGETTGLGDVATQVRRTMLVTLWCFIGIEGAVMMSARARRARDVAWASIIGFLLAWVLYALISVMAFGVMSQPEMSQLENPSVAYLLRAVCGSWAYYFVIISVICSLLGGWIAWTLICAQVPYEAAQHGLLSHVFLRLNLKGVPTRGLLVASIIMQAFFLGVIMAESVYMAAIEISGMMVLPAYFFCGLFLCKASMHGGRLLRLPKGSRVGGYWFVGVMCTVYCAWLMFAGGINLLLMTSLFYLPGLYFYASARREACPGLRMSQVLTPGERWVLAALILCALSSLVFSV